MFKSILFHVANIHKFPEFELFQECLHGPIPKRQWIPIGILYGIFIVLVGAHF